MSASASAVSKRKPAAKRKRRKRQGSGWVAWWPLLLGIAMTPVAVKAATLMALAGPDGLRLLFPWVLLPKLHFLGLSGSLGDALSQAMMYLQFPLYGLFATLVLRLKGSGAAILQLALVHLLPLGLIFVAARS